MFLLSLATLAPQPLRAGDAPPGPQYLLGEILPEPAHEGQQITLRLYRNTLVVCEHSVTHAVSVTGNEVVVTQREQPPVTCPMPPGYVDFPLGRFGAGEYVLYYGLFGIVGNSVVQFGSFRVFPAASVPGLRRDLVVSIATLLLLIGLNRLRNRARAIGR